MIAPVTHINQTTGVVPPWLETAARPAADFMPLPGPRAGDWNILPIVTPRDFVPLPGPMGTAQAHAGARVIDVTPLPGPR